MKRIDLTDITLRDGFKNGESVYTFKERVEIAKVLDRLGVTRIGLPPLSRGAADTMMVRTMAAVVKKSVLSLPVSFTVESVDEAWSAISTAAHPELLIPIPTSSVQMEYVCHRKASGVMELITELTARAKTYTDQVHLAVLDATRTDRDILTDAIRTAVAAGAAEVTLCDTAGIFLPDEMAAFAATVFEDVPELAEKGIPVHVQCNDEMCVGAAGSMAAVRHTPVSGICVTVGAGKTAPSLTDVAQIFRTRGVDCGLQSGLNMTELTRSLRQLGLVEKIAGNSLSADGDERAEDAGFVLDEKDDISAIASAVKTLGYDLSDEDVAKVYESFRSVVSQKSGGIGSKELDAIIATVALQVPPTYRLTNYVINSGSHIAATAHIQMEKNGETVSGVCAGSGPIDAAFLAIDQIIGYRYELDDFQIQSVTEGKEAMGSALVRLRAGGKLYSGSGISTDIIGASIRAYLNAINQIVYEEA